MSFRRILALLLLMTLPSLAADRTLTDEDIVRRVVTGESIRSITDLIRSSATDFDLSDEMVEEMKLAGVPDAIIRVMRERHLELNPPVQPEPSALEVPELPGLVVHLEFKKQPVLPKALPEEVAKQAGIPADEQSRQITAAALFVACTSSTHVPDHWRGKTPLGRDFVYAPRHKMLLFQPVFDPGDDNNKPVKLTLPGAIRLELETGEPHDLVFGLAIEAGGRYLAAVQLKLENMTHNEDDIHRAVSVVQKVAKTLDVKIRKIEFVPEDTEER